MDENQTWISGKRGESVCLTTVSYNNGVTVVTAEGDKLAEDQFVKAVKSDWPETTFLHRKEGGYWIAVVL